MKFSQTLYGNFDLKLNLLSNEIKSHLLSCRGGLVSTSSFKLSFTSLNNALDWKPKYHQANISSMFL